MEQEHKILETSLSLYKKHGIRQVSMDLLAKQLGMSKKTIYRFYKDKKQLVSKCIEEELQHRRALCMTSWQASDNAIQQFLNLSEFANSNLKEINQNTLLDLHRFYPDSWSKMFHFTNGFISSFLEDNMKLGIEQGYYRPEVHAPLFAKLYINSMMYLMNTDLRKEQNLSIGDAHLHLYCYHLNSICTPKGKEYLKNHISK